MFTAMQEAIMGVFWLGRPCGAEPPIGEMRPGNETPHAGGRNEETGKPVGTAAMQGSHQWEEMGPDDVGHLHAGRRNRDGKPLLKP
jgi:hypothetical protein